MKLHLPAVVLATLLLPLPGASGQGETTVRFSNGDRISGAMESLSKDRLVWKSPLLEQPVPFYLKTVLDLTMIPLQPEIAAKHEASMTLTNGDLVRGQLASVSDDIVEMDTWYAGRMKFNRLMVSDIKIAERPDLIYRGPSGLEGWKSGGDQSSWTYQNSGLRSSGSGSIGRDIKLPDECSISFDVAWRNSLYLDMAFFTGDLSVERPTSGYALTLRARYVSLRNCTTGRNIGGTQNVLGLQENEKARIEVRASKKTGKICVYVDGQISEVWTDADLGRTTFGRAIQFISTTNSPVQVSRIEVAAWDGEVEQLPEPRAQGGLRRFGIQDPSEELEPKPEEKDKTGRMELRNGDSLVGEVLSINEGIIAIKTPFRDLKLPIEALRSLTLKPAPREEPKRENGDVRAWFADGSSIVFRLDAAENDTLTGFSQTFGTAVFKASAFSRIEFNLYDPALEDIRLMNGM